MTEDKYYPKHTMAEVAENVIQQNLEKGMVNYGIKQTAFEATINKSLPLIKRVDLSNFVIDFKDDSVLVFKDDHTNPPDFYTQTQSERG